MLFVYKVDDTFDLEKTMECGQCFHYEKIDSYKYLIYGHFSVCEVAQNKNILTINTDENHQGFWELYFKLDMDYSFIIDYLTDFCQKNNDDFGLRAIETGKGIRILAQPFFETCCSYILSQQNNIPRIRKMIFELSKKYSSDKVYFNGICYHCFPHFKDFELIEVEDLKELGFGYRAEYLKEFVDNWEEIADRVRFNYENDFALFKSCRGIGDKVANCICLYGYEEYDAFPIDVWMKKIIKEEYTNKGKELKIPNRYAGILQQFMFYTKRKENGK